MMILQQTRGALSSGDQLALDLPFAATKSLTARIGPTPAFTRAQSTPTSTTFVGADGLIQYAAANQPRFDHDPVTLVCKGLLIEEQRTNLILQSENFGTTWSADGGLIAVSTNVVTSPSGLANADKITENSTTNNRRICITTITAVAGTVYTISCYLKAGERDFAQLAFGGIFGNQYQNFIIGGASAGTLASGIGITSPQITALADGWYRCTATITSAGSGATQVTVGPLPSNLAARWPVYTGVIGSGVYAWGAQLEAGSFPTSYIPTTTTSAVRSADACSITGAAFSGFYNQDEGSFSCVTTKPSTNSNSFIVHASDGTFNNAIDLRYNTATQAGSIMNVSNVTQFSLVSTISASALVKQSVGYKINDCAYSANSGSVITDTSASIPTTNRMVIGNSAAGGSYYLNGTVSSIRYYKKRLPNAKLQALTV